MPASTTFDRKVTSCGDEKVANISVTSDAMVFQPDVSLPAGKAGELTTRTDADTGVITLDEGHGLSSGTFDIYWSGGVHYGVPGTIVGDELTIDGGEGDDLPTLNSDVVVAEQEILEVDVTGNLVQAVSLHSTKRAHAQFLTDADVHIAGTEIPEGEDAQWIKDRDFDGATNPLADATVGKLAVSCGDSAAAAALTVKIPYNNS